MKKHGYCQPKHSIIKTSLQYKKQLVFIIPVYIIFPKRAEEKQFMRAVIFDMDGVIIDSEPIYAKLEGGFFDEQGLYVPLPVRKTFVGGSMINMWAKVAELNPGTSPDELRAAYQIYKNKIPFHYKEILNKGIPELLEYLKTSGCKIGLASSTIRKIVTQVLSECGLLTYFHALVCGDEVVNGKPDPEIFLKAAAALDVSPSECIVIEDSHNGITAAKSAGMYVIGKADTRFNQDVTAADQIITDILEITPDLLK